MAHIRRRYSQGPGDREGVRVGRSDHIRKLQELLGHSHAKTTMIYDTHVLNPSPLGAYTARSTGIRSSSTFLCGPFQTLLGERLMKDRFHAANRKRWDAAARQWAERADRRGLWQRCPQQPELVLCEKELEYLGGISGKRVCVLGSGDNQVVFALAGLGAVVTSVDISQNQLDIAEQRSNALGLAVSFVRADVTDLSSLGTASFDAVYTGGHVAVWVADIAMYYAEAGRILRPNGLFIVNEYHPFRRIWRDSKDSMIVESPYLRRGPFEYDLDDDILGPETGDMKSYEFHWTVADYLNAVLGAGCNLLFVDEYGEQVCDWEGAPMHGLPEFLLIIARKKAE